MDKATSAVEAKKRPRRAAAFGYVACDVTVRDNRVAYSAGGTSANVAANLAVLGWQVKLYARIGTDAAGQFVQEDLTNDGVELAVKCIDPKVSTPVVIVEPTARIPRYKFKCPHCGTPYARHRPVQELEGSAARDADVVFLDRTSIAGIEVAEQARSEGRLVVFEPNGLGSVRLFDRIIAIAHVIKFSNDRAAEFMPRLAAAPRDQIQICTLGEEGFAVRQPTSDWRQFAAPSVSPIDTVGAGDMLTAALLDIWLDLRVRDSLNIDEVVEATLEAQWFAAAQTKHEGARGLTKGRSRDEVLAEVVSVRSGDDVTRTPTHIWSELPYEGCESWLCRNMDQVSTKLNTSPRVVLFAPQDSNRRSSADRRIWDVCIPAAQS